MINNYNSTSYRTCSVLSSQEPEVVGNAPNSGGLRTWWKSASALFTMLLLLGTFFSNAAELPKAIPTTVVTTCAGATVLSPGSLPITNQALVCGATNDLNATNVPALCGGASNSYKGGNESLYSLTPTVSGSYTISISGQSWTGIFIYQGCPTAGGTCVNSVGSSTTSKSLSVTLTAGLEYYIWFDTWPTPNSPCPGTFSIVSPIVNPPNCAATTTPANGATYVVRDLSLSWSSVAGATSYDVYFGSTTPAVFVTNTATTSYTLPSTLAANTLYYYKIVPKNAFGDAVGCAEKSFTTGTVLSYCLPVTDYGCGDGDVIARVTLNTLDNNSGTGCPSDPEPGNQGIGLNGPGYSDYTGNPALTTTLQAGSSYGCTVYAGQWAEGYAAWIDYNDNGTFEASERIGFSAGQVAGSGSVGVLGASATFPIVLACNPPLGVHRLRVRAMYNTNGSAVTPCANNAFGEVEDYLVTITAADPCPAPSNLAVANVAATTADLSWTLGCAETAWEVVIQAAGAGTPTGSGTPSASTTFNATDLPVGTAQEFYVRAVCTEGLLYSSWTGPFAFTTTDNVPGCAGIVSPADGATNVPIVAGGVQLTWTAPATSPTEGTATSYDVYFGTTSGALTLLGNVATPTVNITGVAFSQTNYWRIVPRSSGGPAVGPCAEWSFSTESAPANDICSGAVNLDVLTSPLTSSTVGYNNDFTPTCGNFNHTGPDSYYSITVPNGYTLVIGQTTNNYDSVHTVFYGSCATPTEILCLDDVDETNATWQNTTGSTQTVYWIQDGYQAGAGLFTLAWTLTPPPVVVTSFSPLSVCGQDGGTPITVTGSNFTGTTDVQFNGLSAASFVVDSDTQITAVLPAGDTDGTITVYATPSSNGSATSSTDLVVNPFPTVDPIVGANEICLSDPVLLLSNASANGEWSSSDEAVATVNPISGEVTGLTVGNTVISYTIVENGCTTAVTHNVSVSEEVVITLQPTPVVVVTGTDSSFSVAATGTGLSYQWEVSVGGGPFSALSEVAPYSGTQTNTLLIDNTPGSLNNNEYRCVVSGTSPCAPVESSSAMLNVGNTGIGTNPSDVNLCDNGTAVFTVVATGDIVPPSAEGEDPVVYSYQWYEDQGLGAEPIVDGGNYSGANEATLTIANVTTANNGWTYFVIVNGPANDPQSTIATLNVSEGVSINDQPDSVSVCRAVNTATFSVGAVGTVSTIQWQVSPNGTTGWTNVGTGATLNVGITGSTPVGVTYYKAVVNGFTPCLPIDSDVVTLTVTQPTINVTPSSAAYCAPGAPVSLTASGAVSYVWSPAAGLSATTGDTVLASPSATTIYTVVGTDASGCTNSTSVTVTSSDAIQATATTNLTSVCANAPVQLGVNTTFSGTNYTIGTGIYKFSSLNQPFVPITGTAATGITATADDSVSGSLTIGFPFNYGGTTYNNFRVSSNGLLTFNATGNSGTGNDLATTTATFRPGIAPLWDDIQCTSGITYQVSGSSPNRVLTIQWLNMEWNYQSVTPVISFQVKLYETSNDIELLYRQESTAYTPGATGGATIGLMGTTSSNYVSLQDVSANPVLSTSSSFNAITTKPATGQVYRFTRQTPTYSWTSTPAGFTSSAQNPIANPTESTTYNVVVTSPNGCTATSNIVVNVVSGAAIGTQPASLSQCAGTTATFTVAATGPGLTYAWRKNGTPITGNASATTASLTLTNIVEADEATYDVVVTPSCGSAITSDAVTLTVNDIPTAVATNSGPVCAGSTLNLTGTTNIGVTFLWSGPNGFTSTDQNPSITDVTSAAAGVYTFTATSASNCSFSGTTTVVINANPQITITSSGSQTTACMGEIKTLTADYVAGTPFTLYSENFNAATNAWTKTNASTGGTTPANVAWTLRPSGYVYSTVAYSSNDASQFYMSNPDSAGSGVTSNAVLQSPAFSTVGLTGASISYYHYYRHLTATQNVEYSTNGTTWTSIKTYNTTQGSASAFVQDTVVLPAGAINQPTVYIRFRYQDGWAWYWAIDNFTVTGIGSPPANPTWSPTTDLYTDANATVPYTGGPAHTVYASISSPVTYTATATTTQGCSRQTTASYTMTTTGCPSTTNVQTAQCGSTLSSISQQIYANLVSGAQAYRFRVTDLTTNEIQSIDRVLRVFQLTQLTNYAFNRTYRIEVSVRLGGVWQPYYGASCTVTTPATTTKVQTAQCGSTLTTMNDVVYADNVPYATGYKFRITNLLTSAQEEIERPLREIRLTMLSNPEFNTTYSVEVAVRNTDGTYLPYGASCNITTPSFPTTQLQLSQCDVVITNNNATIYADSYSGATTYRFRFVNTGLGYTYQFDRPLRSFVLSTVPGLMPGETYSVQVSVEIGGVFGPYGKVCTITTPGGTRSIEPEIKSNYFNFQVMASPNPFADNFKLDVKTSTEEMIQVRVYDMLGKLIESKDVTLSSITELEVGTNYPSGVYNVIVSQGENVKTLRVIKR